MGSQILKISPFSLSRTLITKSSSTPLFLSTNLSKTHFTFNTKFSSGFSGRVKRSFRSGIVAMAGPGSVQKSEDEWRAVLSPEQFRILRQKGTEYVSNLFVYICFCYICFCYIFNFLVMFCLYDVYCVVMERVFILIKLGWSFKLDFKLKI